jgi:predicted nucleic acid-binding protein
MIALVDTSVWSLALRRGQGASSREALELVELIREGRTAIMGPIRQELLSGVKKVRQFNLLREQLRHFPDIELDAHDFETAAEFFNRCRARGIQGSNTDFLICAVASRRRHSVFTTDVDFSFFARFLPIVLHKPRS